MTTKTLSEKKTMPMVGMSQVVFLEQEETAGCVVGSCIALVLHHPRMRKGALGHVVLPKSSKAPPQPGKFADTAIVYMLGELKSRGVPSTGMTAKIFGGAAMFGPGGPLRIGEKNIEAVTRLLAESGISIIAQHLEGSKGRRVTFDCATGSVDVDIVGQPTETF